MADQLRRRLACDRCHAQKLRCTKREDNESCARCLKARRSCIFSPSLRPVWPSAQSGVEQGDGLDSTTTEVAPNDSNRDSASRRSRKQKILARVVSENEVPVQSQLVAKTDNGSYHVEHLDFDTTTLDLQLTCKPTPPPLDFNVAPSVPYHSIQRPTSPDYIPTATATTVSSMYNKDMVSPPDAFSLYSSDVFRSQATQCGATDFLELLGDANYPVEPRSLLACPQGVTDSPFVNTPTDGISPSVSVEEDVVGVDATYNTAASCVQRLAQLSARLYEHAGTVPSQSIFNDERTTGNVNSTNKGIGSDEYSVDETYHLTQSLIDLYPILTSTAIRNNLRRPTCLPINQQHISSSLTLEISGDISESGNAMTKDDQHRAQSVLSKCSAFDDASILLILSCHHRILDIWEKIFALMQTCIEHSAVSKSHDGQPVTVATLKIGSFVLSTAAVVPMHISLITRFASQLLNYVCELVGEVAAVPWIKDYNNEGVEISNEARQLHRQQQEAGVSPTHLACEAVMIRASKMVSQVDRLQSLIHQALGHDQDAESYDAAKVRSRKRREDVVSQGLASQY